MEMSDILVGTLVRINDGSKSSREFWNLEKMPKLHQHHVISV